MMSPCLSKQHRPPRADCCCCAGHYPDHELFCELFCELLGQDTIWPCSPVTQQATGATFSLANLYW